MAELHRRTFLLAALAVVGPGCGAKTTAERAGQDQEIARDILWRYRSDIRFKDIRVLCEDRLVTLEGRVPDSKSAADAIQIALSCARGGKVDSQLEVRPR